MLKAICRCCNLLNIPVAKCNLFICRMKLALAGQLEALDELNQRLNSFHEKTQLADFILHFKNNLKVEKLNDLTAAIIETRNNIRNNFWAESFCKSVKQCCHCSNYLPVYRAENHVSIHCTARKGYQMPKDKLGASTDEPLNPSIAFQIVKAAWKINQEVQRTDNVFLIAN